jgi:hypothetical protein
MLLQPNAREDWRAAQASLARLNEGDLRQALSQEDDWKLLEGLPIAMAGLDAELSAAKKVEMLSRVVRVLGALPPHDKGRVAAWKEAQRVRENGQPQALVRFCMMGLIEAARGGVQVPDGALPSLQVLLSQYCVAAAVPT